MQGAEPPAEQTQTEAPGSKGGAKTDIKEGEIVEPDKLADMIHEIENLKKNEALERVVKLLDQTDMTFFELGGVLSVIQANHWFEPYASFRDFVEKQLASSTARRTIGRRFTATWPRLVSRGRR